MQAIIFTVLLALGLVSGGIPSVTNASDIQEDHIDPLQCDSHEDYNNAYFSVEEKCDDLEEIRNSQIASAVSSSVYT